MNIVIGVAVFIGVVLLYLIVIIFFPVLRVQKQPIERVAGENSPPGYRHTVQFAADGTNIHAWLYLPEETAGAVPCVIMSHGFGGTKDCLLEQYAMRFAEAGYATLTYDYRHFGDSEGQPRQMHNTLYQLDDLRAAVSYARSRSEINPEKIVLWGTSASGGYGLAIAAEDARIAAVIAQCAALDHKADSKLYMDREGLGFFLGLIVHAQRDKGRSRFGLSPHTFPIVGRPGTTAMFAAPGAFEGYTWIAQHSETFRNEVCARLFFAPHGPDLFKVSKNVHCPVLLLGCEQDNLAAPEGYKKIAAILGNKAIVRNYPIGHFDIYAGEYFEKAISEKLALLQMI
jgi:uncharacterized protein